MAEVRLEEKPPEQKPEQKQGEEWRNVDEVKRIIAQREEFRVRARDSETKLAQYETEAKTRLAADEQAAAQVEQDRLKNEGKFREALELSEKKWKGRESQQVVNIAKRMVPLAIQSAAGKLASLTPEAINDLPSLMERHLTVDPETFEVFPVGADGKRLVDERLQPVGMDQFLATFVGTRPYLLKDSLPASHGAGGGASKRVESVDLVSLMQDPKAMRQMEADDPAGYAAAVEAWNNPKNHIAIAKAAVARKAAERMSK